MITQLSLNCIKGVLFFIGLCIMQTAFSQKNRLDTLTDLNNPTCIEGVYKMPDGKYYKVKFINDPFNELETEGILTANCTDSTFAGQARKGAKTSVVVAKTEDFNTVSAFFKALAKDAVVRPKLTSRSARIAEENHNVRFLKDTYLFAFKKENDNDYHVIIGDNINPQKATFLNIEVSGLSGSNKQIKEVRRAFEKQFVNVCSSRYIVFAANPVKIQVEGSTFFDVDHKPGKLVLLAFNLRQVGKFTLLQKLFF